MKRDNLLKKVGALYQARCRKYGKRLARLERAAALAEMTIAVPVLILLISGFIEFGMVFSDWQILENAARDGAGIARLLQNLQPDDPRVRAAVLADAQWGTNLSNVTIEVDPPFTVLPTNDLVVTASAVFRAPFLNMVGIDGVTLSRSNQVPYAR